MQKDEVLSGHRLKQSATFDLHGCLLKQVMLAGNPDQSHTVQAWMALVQLDQYLY